MEKERSASDQECYAQGVIFAVAASYLIQRNLLRHRIRRHYLLLDRLRLHCAERICQSITCSTRQQRESLIVNSRVIIQTISPKQTSAEMIRNTSETMTCFCCCRATLTPSRNATSVYARMKRIHSVACQEEVSFRRLIDRPTLDKTGKDEKAYHDGLPRDAHDRPTDRPRV